MAGLNVIPEAMSADDPRNNVGRGAVAKAASSLMAKFKSWGREANGLPATESPIDLSGPAAAFNAWDDRMRNGEPAPAPTTVASHAVPPTTPAPSLPAPAAVVAKPVVAAPRAPRRTAAISGVAAPVAATPAVPQAVNTPMNPGLNGFITEAQSGGYAEISGDPSSRIYAAKADPAVAAAPVYAERDTTYDPGSQGAWARNEGARQLLEATGGSRGLTALGAFDTAQAAPGIAQTKARGELSKQLLENQGKLAETNLKGHYDNTGKWIEAGSREKVAKISADGTITAADVTGVHHERSADITGRYNNKSAAITADGHVNGVRLNAKTTGEVTPALQFSTLAADLKEETKALEAERPMLGKNKEKIKAFTAREAALKEDKKALYGPAAK